jgi:hypothetical protein
MNHYYHESTGLDVVLAVGIAATFLVLLLAAISFG